MENFIIDKEVLSDIVKQHGATGLKGVLDAAQHAIQSGGHVVVQRRYTNASPEVEATIGSIDDLYSWIVSSIKHECPVCRKSLKPMAGGEIRNRYKCYDPPGCGSIFRLSSNIPPSWMKFDEDGGTETPYNVELI